MRHKKRHPNPKMCDPWDVHEEWEVTAIQCWMMWRYSTSDAHLLEVLGMGMFKETLGGVIRAGATRALDDPKFEEQFPVLYAFMAHLVDDDGKPRQGCTLTLVCEDGVLKAGLNERDHQLSLWTSAASLGGAFVALEEALGERPPRWRKKTWEGKRK